MTILKYALYAAGLILIILLAFGLVFLMNWPWWVGFFILLAFVAIIIGCYVLQKILKRKKEQQFVQEVINQDNSEIARLSVKEQTQFKELQDRWKEAVEILKKSHLKKLGNPLYVLPWYLMMGESGSGKTTAIESARLSSPFAGTLQTAGISGTRNCDWWFFDDSIIIDTAGRYAMPVDADRDSTEWQKFLSLLVKYRKKEPIHGLILTVAADKLIGSAPETLEQDGAQLRRRMDELMRVLGIRFPVYLLVTKCDLVQGMTQFTSRLQESKLEQAMGEINQDLSPDAKSFLERVVLSVVEGVKNLRLLMLQQGKGPVPPGLIVFPEELQSLKPGLSSFVAGAFLANRYQDTPLLRGIFFSSGRQEGTPYSNFLKNLGLISEKEVLPGTNRGLFLHDFFARILPADRKLFAPTSRAREWNTLTRNLGIISWILFWIALSGLLSYSFVKNTATIREASNVIARTPDLKGDLLADLTTIDSYRKMIVTVEEQNSNWVLPRFWLNESKQVEMKLKAKYCRQFQERFLSSFDVTLQTTARTISAATPDDVVASTTVHLVRRINLLKARLTGDGADKLRGMPLPEYVFAAKQGQLGEEGKKFGGLFINYLLWRTNSSDVKQEITTLQGLLSQITVAKGGDLRWLLDWVNRVEATKTLTMQSFWGGSRPVGNDVTIAAVYTRKGKDVLTAFIAELLTAHPEPSSLDKGKADLEVFHRTATFSAWQRFAVFFPKGEERLNGAKEWQEAANVMATEQGPYLSFLNRAATELEPYAAGDGVPLWLQQVFQYQILRNAAVAGGAAKAAEEGRKLLDRFEKMFGRKVEGQSTMDMQLAAAKSLQDYQAGLSAIAPVGKSRNQAFQLASQIFSEDQAVSKAPLYVAVDSLDKLKSQLVGGRSDDTFYRLLSGPTGFFWHYVRMESACALQSQWEEKVLQEASGATDPQSQQYLVSPDGPVWKFVKGPAAPFLGWNPRQGYFAKTSLGSGLPFDPSFFTFLVKGAKAKAAVAAGGKPNYTISFRGLPTDTNGDARIKPHATRIELQCASGVQTMENLNFPISKVFTWAPDSCGDLVFQIDVGDLVLTKTYQGPQGFPAFLKDFPGGRHTFSPQDFPKEKSALAQMGIKHIRVSYQLSGGGDIVGQASAKTGAVPRTIAKCWN